MEREGAGDGQKGREWSKVEGSERSKGKLRYNTEQLKLRYNTEQFSFKKRNLPLK